MAIVTSPRNHAKKKTLYAAERNRADVVQARAIFIERRKMWHRSRLVFVDESGVNTAMTRAEAWAPRAERAVDHVSARRWENHTVIAALRVDGICAPMLLPGTMNTLALRAWVRDCLCPELRRGDIVIWDNLSIHQDAESKRSIQSCGARLEFLPPYSPELNPIELAWSKVKGVLRRFRPRDWDSILEGLHLALTAVTPLNCLNWFCHAGYLRC